MQLRKQFQSALWISASVTTGLLPAVSPAQSVAPADQEIIEIVVTAQRREQSIQDIPASVSVVSGDALSESGAALSQDIARLVPNVQWESTSLSSPRIFIRGIGSLEFNANGSASIGLYADDIFLGSSSAANFQLLDIERVEVLRGPQGTLYGRNTTGGAINYIPRMPTATPEGYVSVGYGNYDQRTVEAAFSGPLFGESLTGRIAAKVLQRDGVNENVQDRGDEWGDQDQWAVRGTLALNPGNAFNGSLSVTMGRADQSSLSYQALGVFDPVALANGQNVRCSDERILGGRCVNAFGVGDADPDDVRRAAYDADPHFDQVDTTLAALKLNWDLGFATLTSISGLLQVERDEFQDTDATSIALLHATYTNESDQFSQELRLTSAGGQTFNWIAGAYYFQEALDADNKYVSPAFGGGFATQVYSQDTTAWALFGRGDLRLADQWTLTAGVRFTKEEKDFNTRNGFASTGTVLALSREPSDDNVSGDLVLDYEWTDDLRVYASVARGFKAGGANGGLVFSPLQVTAFSPELVTSYEVGLKSAPADGRVTLNAAAFYYDYKDLQLQVTRDFGSGVPTPVVDNAGAAEVLGLEIEASARITDALRINASAGLLDTKFTEYVDFGGADYTGNELPSAPATSFAFGFDYRIPFRGALEFVLGADTSYRSRNFFTPENSPLTDQDESWLVNARAAMGTQDGRWSLSLWGRNLTDEAVRVGYANLDAFGYKLHSYQDPRTYGAGFTMRFR